MAERRNAVVCTFDPTSPNITAYDFHEWIHDITLIPEKTVNVMQIDDPKRQFHIKMAETQCLQAVLGDTCGQAE